MQVPGVIYCLAFIGNLEAALAHTEVHSVHVYLPGVRLVFGSLSHVSMGILENWNFYVNLRPSSLSNGLHETRKSRVRVNCLIDDKPALAGFIELCEISLVVLDLLSQFFVIYFDVIACPQRGSVWKGDNLNSILATEFVKYLAPVMQFRLAGEQLVSIDQAIVGLRWNSLDHPSSKFWHKHNIGVSPLFARLEKFDELWAAV